MRRRLRAAVVLCALGLTLAGCTETPTVTRANVTPTAPTSAAPTSTAAGSSTTSDPSATGGSSANDDLAALKKAAGIEDCPASDAAVDPVAKGLPDVTLECLGGGRAVRLAGLRGRPMIINVWANWCAPCREEAPFLAEAATRNQSDLLVLGLNYQDPDPARAIEFAQVAAWRYPQLRDARDAVKAPLQVVGIPQTFFVRADGTIAHRQLLPFGSADEIRLAARQYLDVTL